MYLITLSCPGAQLTVIFYCVIVLSVLSYQTGESLMGTLPSFSLSPLEPKFVGAKPIEHAPESIFLELEAQNRLIIERKRNGYMGYVAAVGKDRRAVSLYSRGINDLTEHFPVLIEELRAANVPHDTLLGGEILADVGGTDSPEAFTRIVKSKPEKAVLLQRDSSPVRLAVFNVIVHKGKPVADLPYGDRLDLIQNLFAKHDGSRVGLVEVLDTSFESAKAQSLERGWEGLVLYDRHSSSTYNLDGRIDMVPRPFGSWKWKQYNEGDFVATGWVPSTAKSHAGLVKDLRIAQYDRQSGNLVDFGFVGVGLSRAERREFANDSLYPMVFEIKFERRTVKNRLIQAQILRRRFDKEPHECITP